MKYIFKASQTIFKIIEIEADNEEKAAENAQQMLEEGEIHFDDEPWLEMETNIKRI
ncbi:MAG: hypothetical protein MJZ90_05030 [Bacteroidales bacterium]|nr:hypothetical protein [Bacteroidales bacterium]